VSALLQRLSEQGSESERSPRLGVSAALDAQDAQDQDAQDQDAQDQDAQDQDAHNAT
jgi:hypothetical protein